MIVCSGDLPAAAVRRSVAARLHPTGSTGCASTWFPGTTSRCASCRTRKARRMRLSAWWKGSVSG